MSGPSQLADSAPFQLELPAARVQCDAEGGDQEISYPCATCLTLQSVVVSLLGVSTSGSERVKIGLRMSRLLQQWSGHEEED